MTFTARKTTANQEIVETVTLFLDGCRYATDALLAARFVTIDASTNVAASGTGGTITLSAGDATLFGSSVFITLPSNEIILCNVVSALVLTITGRARFGTTETAYSGAGQGKLTHQGEADGSCYGFAQTCSNSDAFEEDNFREVEFSTAPLQSSRKYFTGLKKASLVMPKVDPGESMGRRGSFKVDIHDQVHNDYFINPYPDRHTEAGTFFGKLLARNPYFEGRKVIYKEGLRDATSIDEPDYLERTFYIDKLKLSRGICAIECLDVLSLADEKKSKVPAPSLSQLSAIIDGASTTISLANGPALEYGSVSSTAYVRIDKEVIECVVASDFVLNITTRGIDSEIKNHKVNATVQHCYFEENIHPVDLIENILSSYSTIPPSYFTDYSALISSTSQYQMDRVLLTKPVAVKKIVDSAIKMADLVFYDDPVNEVIVIEHYPEVDPQVIFLEEDVHLLRDSIKLKREAETQITQFTHLWGHEDITKTEDENYAINYTVINANLISARFKAHNNIAKDFKNPFLTASNDDALIGVSYTSKKVERNSDMPYSIDFELDAQEVGQAQGGIVDLGSIVSLSTEEFQGKDGQPRASLFQILSMQGSVWKGYKVEARRYQSVIDSGSLDFSIDENKEDYDLSTEFSPAAGNYVIYISPGVVIGSTNNSTPAFTTGAQAAGVSFTIINRGQILGAGGDGGNGAISPTSGEAEGGSIGGQGGTALLLTVDTEFDNGAGNIFAGGGGGGGRSTWYYKLGNTGNFSPNVGNGGGGGQGYVGGQGGDGGSGVNSATATTINGVQGENGSIAKPGQLSPAGGEWGLSGFVSIVAGQAIELYASPAPAGISGLAIDSNGNTLTFTSGNNSVNVRGGIV